MCTETCHKQRLMKLFVSFTHCLCPLCVQILHKWSWFASYSAVESMIENTDSATLWLKVGLYLYCSLLQELHVIELYNLPWQRGGEDVCSWLSNQPVLNRTVLNWHYKVTVDSSAAPLIAGTVTQRWSCGARSIWRWCVSFCYSGQKFPHNTKRAQAVGKRDKELRHSLPMTILNDHVKFQIGLWILMLIVSIG